MFENLGGLISKFADDTNNYRVVDREEGCQTRQNIEKLRIWDEKLLMSFNTDRHKIMHVGRSDLWGKYKQYMRSIDVQRDFEVP